MDRSDYLFSQYDMGQVLDNQRNAVQQEINRLDKNRLLNTSVDDLCDYLVEKFSIHVPVLLEDRIVADQQEAHVNVSQDQGRAIRDRSRPYYLKGTAVSIEIPYEGERDIFSVRPSRFSSMFPQAKVLDDRIVVKVTGVDLNPESVKSSFDKELQLIKQYLEWSRENVQSFNGGLRQLACDQINNRRKKLLDDQNLVAAIGFPLKKRDDAARTYAVPTVRRKIKPTLPPASSAPFRPNPTLDDENYKSILNIMDNMVQVMERSPSSFSHMGEEALRDHFLVQLNAQYEGSATGETFNYDGKTDILIRTNGRNIFIGECKFWSGPKKFTATIDQLLGYASWRDTKTAILIFNRNKDFSRVLQAIPSTVLAHPNFKRQIEYGSETSFRFVLHHRDDKSRELILTVMAFEVPGKTEVVSA